MEQVRLSPDNSTSFDRYGRLMPSRKALDYIEREHADKPPAEKWRLAQAQTLIDAFGK